MTQNVAETVTFKLADGVTHDQFIALIKKTEAFVHTHPGFIFRRLSSGADGQWTDAVIWADMETAQAAAAEFQNQDFAPALMAAIAPGTAAMRHEIIHRVLSPT